MPDGQNTKRKLWDRLQDNYRISILDDENLEEVGSYNLSLLSFYTLVSAAALIFASLVIAFIIFTPVRRLIPGYGDISDNRRFIELSKKVDELETEVKAFDTYTNGLKNMLTGSSNNKSSNSESISERQNLNPQSINQSDIVETNRARELDFLKFATPVSGNVSSKFDPAVGHYGTDIVAAKNTPIKSVMDGIVVNADQSMLTGNTLYIQHHKNLISVYKHNSSLLVRTGQTVKTGQAIAIIGNTGEQSTGPHLHIELWYDGKYVNPESFINFQ
jgi:murein DD-endopeptidase MepM/ murein hydrolase activator NlpD